MRTLSGHYRCNYCGAMRCDAYHDCPATKWPTELARIHRTVYATEYPCELVLESATCGPVNVDANGAPV